MVSYKVVMTDDARQMLNDAVDYVMNELQNPTAADDIYEDALETIQDLKIVAGSLRLCDQPLLASRGYRKILFRRHEYTFMEYSAK